MSVDLGVDGSRRRRCRAKRTGGMGAGGVQILVNHLTLFQPEADYAHHITTRSQTFLRP